MESEKSASNVQPHVTERSLIEQAAQASLIARRENEDEPVVISIIWTPGVKLKELRDQVVEAAYEYNDRNKMRTAAMLGISIRTLRIYAKRLNLPGRI
jgi:transcriptional regulator with PAS, ATPase and Fis domain